MTRSQKGPERRRAKRVRLPKKSQVLVSIGSDGMIVNVSATGALVELLRPFPSGTLCTVTVPMADTVLRLKARVVRTLVSHTVQDESGHRTIVYQSGLEFIDLTSDERASLERLLVTGQDIEPPGRAHPSADANPAPPEPGFFLRRNLRI